MSTRMSVSQPVDWKAAAPEPLPGTTTFAAQASLPLLPVPELQATLTRLRDSLKPLAASEEELAATEAKIAEFGAGKALELHQRLLERSKTHKHWLEEWWDNTGYLGYRDSVVVNVSYYYGFDAHPGHAPQKPPNVVRAAYLARATMLFRQKYRRGLLEPEATKEGPICMDTYRWMFDCCRVPGPEGLDWSVTYAKPDDTGNTGHIIVFRNNRPWKVEATHEGRILSVKEFQKQIQYIVDHSDDGAYPGVGVLASNNRDVWAADYTTLSNSSPHNAAILHDIQSAAFTISLDAASPITPTQHSRALWHGDVANGVAVGLQNRWVDKPVQYVVFENGLAGLMGEHSVMDGTPVVRLADDVLSAISTVVFDVGLKNSTITPTPLDWELAPSTLTAIESANTAAVELIEGQELGFHLTTYGKAAIKKFGVSPDGWAQMVVQLAYRRLLNATGAERRGGTYEAASTRRFFKGRTEAIRVVSSESDAWVASMDKADVGAEERKALFDKAVGRHGTLAREAGMGQGVDRHLFGLKKLLKPDEAVPALFTDPLYLRSSYWVLSTSAVFSKHFPVYGWGEVVPDGFGVAYMTGYDDRLQYTITSRKEMPNAQFVDEIARAAEDLYELHAGLRKRGGKEGGGKPRL